MTGDSRPAVVQSRADLVRHLDEQMEFLGNSSELFDQGKRLEAKRLATTLRILLHDTKQSKSLLGQLGAIPGSQFLNTAKSISKGNLVGDFGLTNMRLGNPVEHIAPLSSHGGEGDWLPFHTWWSEQAVFRAAAEEKNQPEEDRLTFSRRDLVLNVADKDGGAHVDAELTPEYAALSRFNALGFVVSYGGSAAVPIEDPVPPALRQIAYEVQCTYDRFKSAWR